MANFSFEYFHVTNPGLIRDNNEDSIFVDDKSHIAILADGVGGHESGEIASSEAVSHLNKVLSEIKNAIESPEDFNWTLLKNVLREGIIECHRKVKKLAQENPESQGMGTTLVFSFFVSNYIFYGHVGDSRLYRYKDKKLTQLTKDHSLYQQMVDERQLYSDEEINNVPKNIITQAIGITDHISPDLSYEALTDKEIYLLCSDGLSDMVSDDEIQELISSKKDLGDLGEKLLESALSAGGKDNVSIILIQPNKSSARKNWINFFKD